MGKNVLFQLHQKEKTKSKYQGHNRTSSGQKTEKSLQPLDYCFIVPN